MVVKCISQNVRGLRTKTSDCSNFLSSSNAVIVALTEMWLNDNILDGEKCPPDYILFRRDRNYELSNTTMGGGVAFSVKSNLLHLVYIPLTQISVQLKIYGYVYNWTTLLFTFVSHIFYPIPISMAIVLTLKK